MSDHYDIIINATGSGGGTLLNKLAPSGKRILVLEGRPFRPCEKENWDTKIAFNTTRYFGPEVLYDKNGGEVPAGICYHVGGNTKLYSAALFRFVLAETIERERQVLIRFLPAAASRRRG